MTRKWQVTLVVCVGVFMSSLDLFIVNVAFPDIARDFGGTSLAGLSWILSAYAIVFAALLVPAGRWADAFGRRRAFLLGLGVFVAASAACALAPSVEVLVAARVAQAAGAALMLPTSLGLMLPEFPAAERPAAIGVWAATGGVAAAAGPPVGGLLVELDWRLVFLVNVPIGLAGLAFGVRILTERREAGARRPDVLGAAGLIVAIGGLVVAIVEGQEWGWASWRVLGLLALTAVLLPAIWRRSARHPAPVVDPQMLRVRAFSLAVAASILFFAAFGAMLLGGVLFLTSVWRESILLAGLMLAPGPIMAAVFSIPSARLGARVGYRIPGVLGCVLFAAGAVWWIARAGDAPAYAATYLPGMVVGGAGVGLVIPTLTGAGAAALAPERLATGIAVLTMGRQIGAALGVALLVAALGTSAATAADFDPAWLIVLGGACCAGLVLAALGPPAPAPADPAPAGAGLAQAAA